MNEGKIKVPREVYNHIESRKDYKTAYMVKSMVESQSKVIRDWIASDKNISDLVVNRLDVFCYEEQLYNIKPFENKNVYLAVKGGKPMLVFRPFSFLDSEWQYEFTLVEAMRLGGLGKDDIGKQLIEVEE